MRPAGRQAAGGRRRARCCYAAGLRCLPQSSKFARDCGRPSLRRPAVAGRSPAQPCAKPRGRDQQTVTAKKYPLTHGPAVSNPRLQPQARSARARRFILSSVACIVPCAVSAGTASQLLLPRPPLHTSLPTRIRAQLSDAGCLPARFSAARPIPEHARCLDSTPTSPTEGLREIQEAGDRKEQRDYRAALVQTTLRTYSALGASLLAPPRSWVKENVRCARLPDAVVVFNIHRCALAIPILCTCMYFS